MNPRNDYLDYEMRKLRLDTKNTQKKRDTNMLLKFLCLLLPLLFIGVSLHATASISNLKRQYVRQIDGGVQFTCKRCRTAQWQDKRQADWRGDYYCKACGVKMGAE